MLLKTQEAAVIKSHLSYLYQESAFFHPISFCYFLDVCTYNRYFNGSIISCQQMRNKGVEGRSAVWRTLKKRTPGSVLAQGGYSDRKVFILNANAG